MRLNLRKSLWKDNYFWWVQDNWTSREKALDFKKHKYLLQIYQDQSPDIVYKKASQVGLTERMLTEALWLPDQYKENSLYLFPTSGTLADLVQERIDDPINNNRYLTVVSGRAKKLLGKWADKVGMKRMSRGFCYFRGSNKPTQITSVSADAVFVDELDRMIVENIPYFDKRTEHSNRRWMRWASTPTIPGFGIDAKYIESDQHEYYLKCPHCGEWQKLTFWDNIDQEREKLICKKCREEIIPWECEAEWRAENPDSKVRGYFISQLYSPRLNISKLIKESKKTAEWEVQQFYNQNLGIAYEPKGAKLTEADFDAAKRDYLIPLRGTEGFMGVDVGKVLHCIIRDRKRVLLIKDLKDFEELDTYMRDYNVKVSVVDALPETREAQKFANRFKGRVYLCYYSGLKEVKEGEWFKKEPQKVNTDRTLSLDMSTDEIKKQELEFPKNLNDYTEFKEHCKNLVRVIKKVEGNVKAEYFQTGPDHYRHALNYARIAKGIFEKTPIVDVFTV